MDLAMKRTYCSLAQGKGPRYEREWNNKLGKGDMEIHETTPASMIVIELEFHKPSKPTTL